jgi:hypothetical protein
MTSETPILGYPQPPTAHQHERVGALPGSYVWGTVVVGTDEDSVADLVLAFDAWAEAELATPVDREYLCRFHEGICRLMALRPDPARLLSPSVATPTENPAADLRRWLSPEIAMPSIAAACGVSERAFYGWLAGAGMRERNARRLHQVRSIVQALMLRRGREQTIEWLLSPQRSLDLATPLDALAAGDQDRVLTLITDSLARATPRPAGPMIAENVGEDFSSYDLAMAQGDPRRRRRRRT